MRTIIAGSRSIASLGRVVDAVAHCGWKPSVVLCGDANGVDKLGARWAAMADVPVEHYPAQWGLHGRRAGNVRNVKMGEKAQAAIVIWDGKSPGSKHMIATAERMGLTLFVYRTDVERGP